MNCIKAENNVYLFETEDRYEVQNQNPKEGTQYSRFAEGYEEAVKIYNEEVLENTESNMDKANIKKYCRESCIHYNLCKTAHLKRALINQQSFGLLIVKRGEWYCNYPK